MSTLKVLRLRENASLPRRYSSGSSGLDLWACLDRAVELTGTPQPVPTGIAIEISLGYEAQIRPRSGLTLQGIVVPLGTIDNDYRGEILVTVYTLPGYEGYVIQPGDRIAQLVIVPIVYPDVAEVSSLSITERGVGGHGSTGT